jgi:hypothetical protein
MARSIRKMTTRQKRNMENTFKIFDAVRCVNKNEKRFMALPHSILHHPSFTSLKKSSQLVYIYMTDYATNGFSNEFTYPRRIYKNIVSNETFKTAIKELAEHGFIEVIGNGKNIIDESLYKFSTKWKDYKPKPKTKRKTKITENKYNSNNTKND